MPLCVIIPGFISTELFTNSGRTAKLWVEYSQLMAGRFGALRLAPDGFSPGPPDGLPIFPGGALPDYWTGTTNLLRQQLAPHGYTTVQLGWDWRMDLRRVGTQLANFITANVDAKDPCAIVAHSAGGLVARSLWAELVSTGEQKLVRRIVTLGTPHQGTYAPVTLWSGGDETSNQLLWLNQQLGGPLNVQVVSELYRFWSLDDFQELTQTWPSLYDLMPLLGGSDEREDPNRVQLYARSKWPEGSAISQAWLTYSADSFGGFLRSPASMPPFEVLTTVAGTGVETPAELVRPELLGQPTALSSTAEGDGLVTESSALVPISNQYVWHVRHADMPWTVCSQGSLAKFVLEVRHAPDPVPPVVVDNSPLVPLLSGPPLSGPLGLLRPPDPCRGRHCQC